MKIRPKLKCWQCEREYTLFREVDEGLLLIVACPFCGAEAQVDLAPYRSQAVETYRGGGEQALDLNMFDLPDVLPTSKRPNETDSLQ